MSIFTEFETNLRREVQMDRIAVNHNKFKGNNRLLILTRNKILKRGDLGATAIGREMIINRSSVYHLLKKSRSLNLLDNK